MNIPHPYLLFRCSILFDMRYFPTSTNGCSGLRFQWVTATQVSNFSAGWGKLYSAMIRHTKKKLMIPRGIFGNDDHADLTGAELSTKLFES